MKIRGRKFTYLQTKKRLPNGKITRLEMIIHPGAVLIVPFLSQNKIILLKQYRAVLGKYLYEFPAGTLNPKENILSCAKRELVEETGFQAKTWKKIGKIYPVPGYSTEIIHIFKAEGLIPKKALGDEDEIIHPRVISHREIDRLMRENLIHDEIGRAHV